jgi:DNA polymerase III alpha subunit
MGINVLAPDVNESIAAFSAVGTDIKFGLGAVRNVGLNVVEGIVAARQDKGRFTSFHDFLRKVPAVVCSKRVIESLIKAGAFDNMGNTRRALVEIRSRRMRPTARSTFLVRCLIVTQASKRVSAAACPIVRNGRRKRSWPSNVTCSVFM